MDQDAFRNLLRSSSHSKPATGATHRSNVTKPKPKKDKGDKGESSNAAFKPRSVKKASSSYRDRAAERRTGVDTDETQIQTLAKDWEQRAIAENLDKETIEQQRQYLGGDADHSVLVKGLDFALLEQNKAKVTAAASIVDDDALEQAFAEGTSAPDVPVPKKRTREEIVAQLKHKRQKTDDGGEGTGANGADIEEAKKAGKFKPIGFKPIGTTIGSKTKGDEKGGAKKKKKKAKAQDEKSSEPQGVNDTAEPKVPNDTVLPKKPSLLPPPEPILDDVDIFADVGEYAGLDLGDSDEEGEGAPTRAPEDSDDDSQPQPTKTNWFGGEEEEGEIAPSEPQPPAPAPADENAEAEEQEEGQEEETTMRLVPLASSSVPSIKDILAMDDEAHKEHKRKLRKEKKKKAAASNADQKLDRDYQRYKSYTEKKSAAGS